MILGITAGGGVAAAAPPNDPFLADVVALLHFDGPDGSTTFTDFTGKTWSAVGNAQLDESRWKFNNSSLQLDGSGDYLTSASSADFAFGTGDFTVEGFVRINSSSNFVFFATSESTANAGFVIFAKNLNFSGVVRFFDFVTNSGTNGTANLAVGTWYHLAVVRASGVITFYVDGVASGSFANTSNFSAGAQPRIGGYSPNSQANGHIDEVRITKGVARYTANFAPPTAPFPEV